MTFQEKQQRMLSDLLADRAKSDIGSIWWHRLNEKIKALRATMGLDK